MIAAFTPSNMVVHVHAQMSDSTPSSDVSAYFVFRPDAKFARMRLSLYAGKMQLILILSCFVFGSGQSSGSGNYIDFFQGATDAIKQSFASDACGSLFLFVTRAGSQNIRFKYSQ